MANNITVHFNGKVFDETNLDWSTAKKIVKDPCYRGSAKDRPVEVSIDGIKIAHVRDNGSLDWCWDVVSKLTPEQMSSLQD